MARKPIWAEGALVSQHNFQAQDLYHEQLLQAHVHALQRFPWGVLDLAVDERLLLAGQFKLDRFSAIMPDGLLVQCGQRYQDAAPEARSFQSLFTPDMNALDVMVGIPSLSTSANVVGHEEHQSARRFGRSMEPVPDFNTGGAMHELEFAIPRLNVYFGSERLDNLSVMRIGQLVRESSGRIALRDNFVPPLVHGSASPFLMNGLRRVLGAMTARHRELASNRKQRTAGNIDFHFADARRFWLLHTLSGEIPQLTHFIEAGRCHPEELYLSLTRLLGQLTTFATDTDVSVVPRYNHEELGAVFDDLFSRILSLLFVDSAPTYVEVPLERRRDDGVFLGKISETRILNYEFFVAVTSSFAESIVREQVPQLLKMASWNHIADVVKQARYGVRTEIEWHPSSALPVKPGVCFFRVRREGPFWEEIVKTRTLALYLPRGPEWRETLLHVYAVNPEYLR